ncbi:30S ribosomal protein S1 [bacterium]|nr:MAG: 30S ribosomal protein S1 [bacterium]MBL7995266.1 30S ribosomal protein S1 [bacterium]
MSETKTLNLKRDYGKKVIPLAQFKEMNGDYDETEFNNYKSLYEKTLTTISQGEIVKGKILAISEKEVKVDIGFKSEGIIPTAEFGTNLEKFKIGDDIEVFLDNIEDKEGQIILSHKKADFMRVWERITKMHETGEVVSGTITKRIKGGMVVNVLGIDCFLPGSQIDVKPIRDFDAYVNREMQFKVVKLNNLRKNVVVSSRALIEESTKGQRERILTELQKGQILDGTVKNITDFGAFIDLGGVDGLLHITDMSWGRVKHPSEIVKLDEKVKVMVIDFNEQKDRISLGMKQMQAEPWVEAAKKYPVNTLVKGKIVSITDYGAFIELEKGIEGLIHISEMSWNQTIKHPSQVFNIGDEIEAEVVSIVAEERKVSLSIKKLQNDPWENVESKYPLGSKHLGKVRNLTNFGVFVELEPGIDGLVHISDLSWTRKVRNPNEIVKKGDDIEVVIMGIDKENRRISMSHKHIGENPWDGFIEAYSPGTETTGKVSRTIEKGLIVELPLGVEGFIPSSHLPKSDKKDSFAEGVELNLVVIEFDKDNKKIVLSSTEFEKAKEAKLVEEYNARQQAGAEETKN